MARTLTPLADRLAAMTAPPDDNGCTRFTGRHTNRGYGSLSRGRAGAGAITAHRAAWECAHGPIPDGLCVMHKCDVKDCVNVAHLELGTNTQNRQDALSRGLIPRGVDAPMAKLTEGDVRYIRDSPRTGVEMARMFGIGPMTVSWIRRRITWKHVP